MNKTIGSIKYSLAARSSNPGEEGAEKMIVAVAQSDELVTTEMLAEHIAEHNSVFSPGTIFGLLKDMAACVREFLLAGKRVQLADLATVRVTLSSEGAEDAEKFTTALIKKVNVRFAPADKMKNLLSDAEFEHVVSLKEAAEARKKAKQDLNSDIEASGSGSGSDSESQGGSGSGDPGDVTP